MGIVIVLIAIFFFFVVSVNSSSQIMSLYNCLDIVCKFRSTIPANFVIILLILLVISFLL